MVQTVHIKYMENKKTMLRFHTLGGCKRYYLKRVINFRLDKSSPENNIRSRRHSMSSRLTTGWPQHTL